MTTPNKINFPPPKLQIDFAFALKRFRAVYLQSALLKTVRNMDIAELDKQLAEYVPSADLAILAQSALRAELLFAVPAVLEKTPYLLGYYRLLMGYSQKEFYGRDKGFGVGHFKCLEEKGKISKVAAVDLPDLCVAFCATGRPFLIEFAPDPDIIIREEMERLHYRNVVAIEVKSGTDASNIHNRIGEAEKSHQKARRRGFTECWTVVNVGRLDLVKARNESPSTNRFYSRAALSLRAGDEYDDFRRRVLSLTAIPAAPALPCH